MKDEGWTLNTLINVLKSIVKCETLGLKESFQGTCISHVFPSVPICHY